MRLRFICLLLVFLSAVGCERRSAAQGRMTAIEANLHSLRQVPGRLKTDAGESPFTAYFQQMELQFVEELPKDGSPLRNRYYYVEGKLFSYRQVRAAEVEKQFVIDRKGALRNAKPEPFNTQEYQQVASRATALKDAAMERAGHMFVFPLMRNR